MTGKRGLSAWRLWGFLVLVLFVMPPAASQRAQPQLDPRILESAVQVVALWFDAEGELEELKTGSGAIVHPRGLVVTNSHVIHEERPGCGERAQGRLADRIAILRTRTFGALPVPEFVASPVRLPGPQGEEREADDPEKDLALLLIDGRFEPEGPQDLSQLEGLVRDGGLSGLEEALEALPADFAVDYPLELGAFARVDPLDDFLVSGYPLLGPSALTFSRGPVSAPDLEGIPGFFLLDARDGPGMSGSPVLYRADLGVVGVMCGVKLGRIKFRPSDDAMALIEAACQTLQLSGPCPRLIPALASQRPQASFTFRPEDPTVGEPITFDASASFDPDGRIDRYEWDFGDGRIVINKRDRPEDPDPKPTEQHAFDVPGTYEVTLTVTDNSGLSSLTTQILMVAPLPELAVRPQTMSFQVNLTDISGIGPAGQAPPIQTQSLEISNLGGGTLNWIAQTDAPWLKVIPDSGAISSGTSLQTTVLMDAVQLWQTLRPASGVGVEGPFQAAITLRATGAIGSPQLIPVNVDIECSLCAAVSVPSVQFEIRPPTPFVFEPVTFDASASSPSNLPGDEIELYVWDFGDGESVTATEPVVQHTYTQPGTFLVRLTLRLRSFPPLQEQRTASRTRILHVVLPLPAPPPSCPFPFFEPVFSDDFSDPGSGWPVRSDAEVEMGYEDGAYGIFVKQPNRLFWSVAPTTQRFTDFCIEVEAQPVEGPLSEYGVLFRYQDEDNFYAFSVRTDGFYRLDKRVQGEWISLIPWTPVLGEVSPIVVVAQGPEIRLQLGFEVLATVTDSSLAEGSVALFVGTFEEPNVKVLFDRIEIFQVPLR